MWNALSINVISASPLHIFKLRQPVRYWSTLLLIEKLYNLNIAGNFLGWIQDFLNNRFQQVLYKGVVSAPKSVSSGIIQVSVFGPLLFLGCISDLPQGVVTCDMLLSQMILKQ